MQKVRLTESNPEWEVKYVESKISDLNPSFPKRVFKVLDNLIDIYTHPQSVNSVEDILNCIGLLLNEEQPSRYAIVVGCGPKPDTVRELDERGYSVLGVEPVEEGVRQATEFLKGSAGIVLGTAENIPAEDHSQSLVLMENVLEHVDSVVASLKEAYRVLQPGGVLFIRTTNRNRFSISGVNWEFSTRFYNWFPRMVKESYVFSQLHYRPELARYSPRPAVHWFSFPDLCDLGREVGFARFYSPFDLLYLTKNMSDCDSRFKIRHWCRRQPWLRSVIVSQMSGDIFMWKRPELIV